jgi:hypothetical protein
LNQTREAVISSGVELKMTLGVTNVSWRFLPEKVVYGVSDDDNFFGVFNL